MESTESPRVSPHRERPVWQVCGVRREPSCIYQLVTSCEQIQIETQKEKGEKKRTENTGSI